MKAYRRLRFDGIENFRDLGGWECNGGGMTKYGIFYRSTELAKATKADLQRIEDLGIRTILDLRHPQEITARPDPYPKSCVYKNISVQGSIAPGELKVNGNVYMTHTLCRMYRQLLTVSGDEFRKVLFFLADAEAPALFHCVAGKDRTGLTAMFLYTIAGVDEKDIVADYEVSHTYIKGFMADVSGSRYTNMEKLLDFLHKTYGGVMQYLDAIGVTDTVRKKIYKKFVMS
ncbi:MULTISPECIES: tyrosine-protein phosphatase [Treponema]|uniref:tyrosine-protein phosphatase n=1 Tax=Treponema TaxID=157 RepID=UPI001651F50A|nr:tyrosine-protein phosphatase [Treponema sp. Marseille-Q4130]MBC6720366.1 tyrosine-protein phosphatase [Treponema sp. Marseille-Q4130]